jgi:hypothetical protein
MAVKVGRDGDYLLFRCPGCAQLHQIHTKPNGWTWDGSTDVPTFSPSVLVQGPLGGVADGRCHSFVRSGRIEFLSDCSHALAGQTVDLPDLTGGGNDESW